jgi:hypothetical protein
VLGTADSSFAVAGFHPLPPSRTQIASAIGPDTGAYPFMDVYTHPSDVGVYDTDRDCCQSINVIQMAIGDPMVTSSGEASFWEGTSQYLTL